MKPTIFTLLLLVFTGFTVTAQLSILPQVGFENTRTSVSYNNLESFLPLGGQVNPQLSLRMDYKFNQQHGPFLGISTSRSLVSYQFSDPDNGMKLYNASAGDMQLRMEGGYQFSSKPFYFSKSKASASKPTAPASRPQYNKYKSYYSSGGRCGRSSEKENAKISQSSLAKAAKQKEKGWYLAVQPLIGAALIPSVNADISQISTGQSSYVYHAGNWNTALITGAGLEFGKNVQKKFVVTIQYLKGLGNLDRRQLTTMSGAKESVTQLRSDVSGWSVKAGFPITLSKKKPEVKKPVIEQPRQVEKKYGQYKSRCNRAI